MLDFQKLGVTTLEVVRHENQTPYPARRDDFEGPLRPDKLKQTIQSFFIKTLLHNAAMVERFIAVSGKTPNMRLNNTDFKELLFYGVCAAV